MKRGGMRRTTTKGTAAPDVRRAKTEDELRHELDRVAWNLPRPANRVAARRGRPRAADVADAEGGGAAA
jgi:hypothetical protein